MQVIHDEANRGNINKGETQKRCTCVHCIIFVPAAFLSVSLKLFLKSTFIPYLSDPRNNQVVRAL